MPRQQGAFHHVINSLASRNDFFCAWEHGCFRSMPVAVLKSMSDVVTGGLICEADSWELESEREKKIVKQREGADRERGDSEKNT